MTPAQAFRVLLAHLPGKRKEQAAALGVSANKLSQWLMMAAHDDAGTKWTRYEKPPTEAEIERLRGLVREHRAEIDAV